MPSTTIFGGPAYFAHCDHLARGIVIVTPDFEGALETPRFTLEPLRRAHAQELFELLSDERLYPWNVESEPPMAMRE